MKNHHRYNRKQLRDNIRFVRKVGQIMLQWEQQHASEIDQRTFLLKPEAQERFETIQQHIQNAKIPPLSFWYGFDPMYNQLNITIEEYVTTSATCGRIRWSGKINKEQDSIQLS